MTSELVSWVSVEIKKFKLLVFFTQPNPKRATNCYNGFYGTIHVPVCLLHWKEKVIIEQGDPYLF